MKEYKKCYKFPKEKKQRNLNVLDVNGKMLSERKMLMDRWKECFKGKISNHGQLNIEFHMEEFDINVTNKEMSESRYLRDEVLNFKGRKQQGQIIITTEIAIYVTVTEE